MLGLCMCSQGFVLSLGEKSEFIFESREEGLFDLWVIFWFISQDKTKWGFLVDK